MASSMDFYYSVPFRSFCKTRLDKVQFSIDNYEKYFDVEARVVPLDANTKVVDPEKLIEN